MSVHSSQHQSRPKPRRQIRHRTVYGRFVRTYLAVTLASLLVFSIASALALRQSSISSEREYLGAKALGIRELLNTVAKNEVAIQEMNRQLRSLQGTEGLEVYLAAAHGWGQYIQNPIVHDELVRLTGVQDLTTVTLSGDETRFILSPHGFSTSIPTVIAVIASDAGNLFIFRSRIYVASVSGWRLQATFWGLVFAFLVIGSLSLWILLGTLKNLLRPLNEIAAVADGILSHDYSLRVSEPAEQDLHVIATSVNRMVEKLAQLEDTRQDYMGRIAHELRTPLTILRGTITGILDGVIDPAREPDFLQVTLKELDRMEALVNNLIDLSVLEQSDFPLDLAETDLTSLLQETVQVVLPSVRAAGQTILSEIPGDLNGQVDPARIRQVLMNLLGNAIKYAGGAATIRLGAVVKGGQLCVTVEDNGPGIPTEDCALIFEKYRIAAKRGGGTGLGLSVARSIVQAHGGSIRVESDGKSYTRFIFCLPV